MLKTLDGGLYDHWIFTFTEVAGTSWRGRGRRLQDYNIPKRDLLCWLNSVCKHLPVCSLLFLSQRPSVSGHQWPVWLGVAVKDDSVPCWGRAMLLLPVRGRVKKKDMLMRVKTYITTKVFLTTLLQLFYSDKAHGNFSLSYETFHPFWYQVYCSVLRKASRSRVSVKLKQWRVSCQGLLCFPVIFSATCHVHIPNVCPAHYRVLYLLKQKTKEWLLNISHV